MSSHLQTRFYQDPLNPAAIPQDHPLARRLVEFDVLGSLYVWNVIAWTVEVVRIFPDDPIDPDYVAFPPGTPIAGPADGGPVYSAELQYNKRTMTNPVEIRQMGGPLPEPYETRTTWGAELSHPIKLPPRHNLQLMVATQSSTGITMKIRVTGTLYGSYERIGR